LMHLVFQGPGNTISHLVCAPYFSSSYGVSYAFDSLVR
jgi:hypothetical protein